MVNWLTANTNDCSGEPIMYSNHLLTFSISMVGNQDDRLLSSWAERKQKGIPVNFGMSKCGPVSGRRGEGS